MKQYQYCSSALLITSLIACNSGDSSGPKVDNETNSERAMQLRSFTNGYYVTADFQSVTTDDNPNPVDFDSRPLSNYVTDLDNRTVVISDIEVPQDSITYFYDANGRPLRWQESTSGSEGTANCSYQFNWRADGQLGSITPLDGGTCEAPSAVTYEYNDQAQLESFILITTNSDVNSPSTYTLQATVDWAGFPAVRLQATSTTQANSTEEITTRSHSTVVMVDSVGLLENYRNPSLVFTTDVPEPTGEIEVTTISTDENDNPISFIFTIEPEQEIQFNIEIQYSYSQSTTPVFNYGVFIISPPMIFPSIINSALSEEDNSIF